MNETKHEHEFFIRLPRLCIALRSERRVLRHSTPVRLGPLLCPPTADLWWLFSDYRQRCGILVLRSLVDFCRV